MAAPDPVPSTSRRNPELGLTEVAGAETRAPADPSAPVMAVSIAGVSRACSKDALRSSARAVPKTLADD